MTRTRFRLAAATHNDFCQARSMKTLAALTLLSFSFGAFADCKAPPGLEGSLSIESCDPKTESCRPSSEVLYEYLEQIPEEPSVLTVAVQTSPWRMYDGHMRVLTAEELAARIRPSITDKVERVSLIGSWTGVAPEPGGKSLADKLSAALDGFPVSGMDGFLWIAKDGGLRTTHQAFTVRNTRGPYYVRSGDEVMTSLSGGWPSYLEEHFVKLGDADGMMRAAAGWDIFFLCPEHALTSFEAAAKLSNPIAAYNAALMRLESGDEKDRQAAMSLLAQAAELDDQPAQDRLQAMKQADAGETADGR
jgi:hypothetical protein